MARPDVLIEQTNGNLGRVANTEDGTTAMVVTGVAVADQFALGDILGPFFSVEDARNVGIDAAYDETNSALAYEHIRAFFEGAGNGTKLYVMVVADTVLLSEMVDKDQPYLAKICSTKKDVKAGVATRIPDAAYVPEYDGQVEEDILLAVTKAKALVAFERSAPNHRYMHVYLEGRNWQGNPAMSTDLRSLNSDRVTIVAGADNDVSTKEVAAATPYLKYAFAGFYAGIKAGLPVQRNAGRVRNGALLLVNAGMSNGAKMETFNDSQLTALHNLGYVFAWDIEGKGGWYINDDHVCTEITSDYAYSTNGRVADKVSRITRQVYVEELLDEVEINPETGGLPVSVAKAFQERLEKVLNILMVNTKPKEASAITVYVDPIQNILATDKIEAETNITPVGYPRTIKVTQSFVNPFNN